MARELKPSNKRVIVLMTDEEKEALEECAKQKGLSLSDTIREALRKFCKAFGQIRYDK